MNKLLALFFTAALLASCETNTVFSEVQALDGQWGAEEVVAFQLPQLDSLKKYNLYLNIRNTNEYKFNNIFCIVSMNFPNGKTVTDTLEYRMANPDGSWMGHGIGDIKDNKLWYKENVQFFEEGNYTVHIGHAVRNNGEVDGVTKLEGITDVGFSVEEASKE
ncbi:gliding motility lipoprotein GldH [Aequorivita sp. SDUM287046]|uniref:Gliding motility lipoprotein GldH n=1 Tax=Aequorivita aurantiaca TaxID=3053356 RepID=A0ABT8DDD1_9FLAO|nr:gliding motility lipoprotein GldH [Aequorivita aurantiaca]MDN3723226.1 gliding motility lipoprotein GldH [Aequorivita aurantiaca]